MIYHKFSHGAAFYMLNGKNVNVMLELVMVQKVTALNPSLRKLAAGKLCLSAQQ